MFAGLLLLFRVLLESGEALVAGWGEGRLSDAGERSLSPVNEFLNLLVRELKGEVMADAVAEGGVGDLKEGFGLFLDGLAYCDLEGLQRAGAGSRADVDSYFEPRWVTVADLVEEFRPLGVIGPKLVYDGFRSLIVDLLTERLGGGQGLRACGGGEKKKEQNNGAENGWPDGLWRGALAHD